MGKFTNKPTRRPSKRQSTKLRKKVEKKVKAHDRKVKKEANKMKALGLI